MGVFDPRVECGRFPRLYIAFVPAWNIPPTGDISPKKAVAFIGDMDRLGGFDVERRLRLGHRFNDAERFMVFRPRGVT